MIGLATTQLLLVGIGRTVHPASFEAREMPLWTASYTAAQLTAANGRMESVRFLPYLTRLLIGQGDGELRFEIATSSYFEDNAAQGKAMRARLASVPRR